MSVAPADAGRPESGAAGARVGRLFADHGRMVYGLCRMLLRDPVEAEDAAQEVFLSAHRGILGGTVPREPAAWLAAIARNECRARAHARMRAPLELPEEFLHTGEGVHEQAVRREDMAALRVELEQLPDRQREAVVLRDLYGLRYEEVGAALGLSRPSVEALLFRGRRRLQVRLADLRAGVGVLGVPVGLQHGLARSIPGFTQAATGGAGAAAGGIAIIAKLSAAPLAAKLAIGTIAVTAAGTAGFVAADRPAAAPRRPPAVSAPVAVAPAATAETLTAIRPAPQRVFVGGPRSAGTLVARAPARTTVHANAAVAPAATAVTGAPGGGPIAPARGDQAAPAAATAPAGADLPQGTDGRAPQTGDSGAQSGDGQAPQQTAQGEGQRQQRRGEGQSSQDQQPQSPDQQFQPSDQQSQPSDQQQPQQPSADQQQSSSGDGTSSSSLSVSSQSGDSGSGSGGGTSGSDAGDSTSGG